MIKTCEHCGLDFKAARKSRKFCSRTCCDLSPSFQARRKAALPRGSSHPLWRNGDVGASSLSAWLKRHFIPTNKCSTCGAVGQTEWVSRSGRKRRDEPSDWFEVCLSCHRKAFGPKGEDHYRWKGQDAGYFPIHAWINRHWQKAGSCERCGAVARTEWANVSGRCDRTDRSDWRELCQSCHRVWDYHDPKRPAYLLRAKAVSS